MRRRQKALHKIEETYFGKANISILYFQEVDINNSELKNIFKITHSVTSSVVLINANVEHCISSA